MTFDDILTQVLELLQRQGRVSYGALKRRFALDDDYLQDLKDELISAQQVAIDEDGKVLVWTGRSAERGAKSEERERTEVQESSVAPRSMLHVPRTTADGERRQLTVMFCDLVGSTTLSTQLDPEELRGVVQAYQQTCAEIIRRYEGYIAQYLGDGLLVYFGYPVAHEDDARRAVRVGLEIVAAVGARHAVPLQNSQVHRPLQVRIGIHTGLVVVSDIGTGSRSTQLALGETPNLASRLQGIATPNTVVISAATQQLTGAYFECQSLGPKQLKGIAAPVEVYRVVNEDQVHNRPQTTITSTPLVGREQEIGILLERWERAKEGAGQVILLSGEAGIGKSRLAQVLRTHAAKEPHTSLEFRCSPYYQNTALYPVIEVLQRILLFTRTDSTEERVAKLENALTASEFPLQEVMPLLAILLSLPLSDRYPPLNLSPQRQKQKTLEAVLAWLLKETEQQLLLLTWEDLHWADPSTLELLSLLVDQAPTARLLAMMAFRPEFRPSWALRSHVTQLTLNRLSRKQAGLMIEKIAGETFLPVNVLQQVIEKTDGVPLFVEELTKAVVESGHYGTTPRTMSAPPLAIPATLQDSLMARLDRLGTAKEIAQLAAALGREFSYELLHAVSPLEDGVLQKELARLVEAELLYQRGLPPQVHYIFKHALIQDAAYQALLRSRRQHYHQQIAQVLEEKFYETTETPPELLAHHYTEAGLVAHAIPYWQQAGQKAVQRSVNLEAISHLTKGLELLKTLPDSPERADQELALQLTLGVPLIATKGFGAPEVESLYTRARELCVYLNDSVRLFPVLWGLWVFHGVRAEFIAARELGEQLLNLAQQRQDPDLLLQAHHALWATSAFQGELSSARIHTEQGLALYHLQQHSSHAFLYGGHDPGVCCRIHHALVLWLLGYPDQALQQSAESIALAQALSHPNSLAWALSAATMIHQLRREEQTARARADAAVALSKEQEFPIWLVFSTILQGWSSTESTQEASGIDKIKQALAIYLTTGAQLWRSYFLALLTEKHTQAVQYEQGLAVLTEALEMVHKTGEHFYEAELYRLKGELTLKQSEVRSPRSEVIHPQPATPNSQAKAEAEAYFHKAIEIARRQKAKSLELRAVMSLGQLWQEQNKEAEARQMLAKVYGWFTEGFDTADLKEAKALLEEWR